MPQICFFSDLFIFVVGGEAVCLPALFCLFSIAISFFYFAYFIIKGNFLAFKIIFPERVSFQDLLLQILDIVVVVQLPIHVRLFVTPWTAVCRPSVPQHLLKFAQVHVHCISDAIQPSYPLMPSSSSAFNLYHDQGIFQ